MAIESTGKISQTQTPAVQVGSLADATTLEGAWKMDVIRNAIAAALRIDNMQQLVNEQSRLVELKKNLSDEMNVIKNVIDKL